MPKHTDNPFIPPKNHAELITWLDAKRLTAEEQLPTLRFKLNLAFVLGHQWIAWDPRRKQWARPTIQSDDVNAPVRLVVNKVASIVERAVAKLTKENPLPECRPASDDANDVSAAKVGTRMLTHELNRLSWASYMVSFYFWPIILGWSYTHVAWDAEGGDTVEVDEANTDPDEEELNEGNIVIEEVPAFELVFDPAAIKHEDARWCIRTVSTTKEDIFERWGVHDLEDPDTGRSIIDEVHDLSGPTTGRQRNEEGFYMVHQYWLRPGGRAAPNGLVVTWCGKTILEDPKDFPYDHGRLPFVQAECLPGLHNIQGRTWFDDLIPLQTDYNDARSRETELRRTLTPKLLYPVGSIDPQKINSRLQMIPYANVNGKPELEVPDSGWITQFEQGMVRADAEMGERSGQSDATSGQSAAGMPAAAILALQEADDTKLAISAKLLAKHVQDVGWHMLMLIKQYWSEKRMIRTWSEEGDLQAQRFSSADVENVLDVHVESGSALPRSRAARTQLAMQLAPLGVFPDPRFLFKILNIPGTEFLMEHMNIDAKQAQRETSQLRQGIIVQVHDFDNHAVHLTEHDNFRKTQEYESMDDQLRAVIDAHCGVHNELILAASGVPTGSTPQIDSENMPPVPGTPTDPELMALQEQMQPGAKGSPPADGVPMYVNAQTGAVNDPLSVAAGQSPSALTDGPSQIRKAAGIGGSGQPGAVPGSADNQAGSMGR